MGFKIAFIGAGSIGFTRELLGDLLTVPEFRGLEVAFTDINPHNLDMVRQLCQRDIDANGLAIRIETTTDRRAAVAGAKYVFNMVRVGGLEAFATDIDIPLRYGVDQCVGDTLCAGGILYGQRGIAAVLDFCKDIREVALPGCLLLNYANPNAMLTWACNHYGGVQTIGLCHGVPHGAGQIEEVLGIPKGELDYICAGINHQTWYVSLKHKGKDVSAGLLEAFERHPTYRRTEKVRIDMLRRFGYYSTESNGHLSEYVAWYRKRPDAILDWIDTESSWIDGETGGYLRVCTEGRTWFETDFPNWMKEPARVYNPETRGDEHGTYIIESLETGRIYRGHFNVVNRDCIPNLPEDCIVEVPCFVDANGISIPRVDELPTACAAICAQSVWVQRLSVEAAVTGDDRLLRQALMLDPLTGAVCTPPEIWQMCDEMLVAGEKWLPQYTAAIAEAKARLSKGLSVPVREGYRGAARLHVKSFEELSEDAETARAMAGAAAKENVRPRG
jgi:alpha-galactosidase